MHTPYGKVVVTTAGQPMNAALNLPVSDKPVQMQSVMFQVLPGNTGIIYIFAGMKGAPPADDRSTLRLCVAILPAPVSATQGPFASASFGLVATPASLNLRDYWIDASTGSTNGVIISGTMG